MCDRMYRVNVSRRAIAKPTPSDSSKKQESTPNLKVELRCYTHPQSA